MSNTGEWLAWRGSWVGKAPVLGQGKLWGLSKVLKDVGALCSRQREPPQQNTEKERKEVFLGCREPSGQSQSRAGKWLWSLTPAFRFHTKGSRGSPWGESDLMRVVFGGNYPGTTQLQISLLQIIIHHSHLGKHCHACLSWWASHLVLPLAIQNI